MSEIKPLKFIEDKGGVKVCLNYLGLGVTSCRTCHRLDGEISVEKGIVVRVSCTNRKMHEISPNLPLKGTKKPVGRVTDSEGYLITLDNGWCLKD